MRYDVTGWIGRVLEQLGIKLTVSIYNFMARIGEEREIWRATLLHSLTFYHLLGAFDVIRAESKNLGGFFQSIIEQVLQLAQLSCARTSPVSAVHHKDNILAAVL